MKRNDIKFFVTIGLFFIVAGLLISSPFILRHFQNTKTESAFSAPSSKTPLNKKPTVSGMPTHIELPSVDISIDVQPGYYNKSSQTWSLSTTKAQYATVTPEPNDGGGNTFIYGHNRWEVFYKLLRVKEGDQAIVSTSNNHKFVYRMASRRDVKPTDSSLFRYQGPPILTLQTCSGFWYQNRSLFVFDLVKVV